MGRPFELTPATALGTSSTWSTQLRQVLYCRADDRDHFAFITDTERAGTVAVHTGLALAQRLAEKTRADAGRRRLCQRKVNFFGAVGQR